MTSRPLPDDDASMAALSPEQRAEIAEHWLNRAAFELRVGDAFKVIGDALQAVDGDPSLVELAQRAVDDELRHGEISRIVASRYAGVDLSYPPSLALVVPNHPGAEADLRHTLHVVGQCVLNETFASAVLESSLAAASGRLAKAALRELLADEVDHARLGWGHLAGLSSDERGTLTSWVPGLLKANLRMWRQADRPYGVDPAIVEHGGMSREVLEPALLRALDELIVPGLAHLGFDVTALESWLAQGAPT